IKYVPSKKEYTDLDYLPFTPSNEKTQFTNNILHFSYRLESNLTAAPEHLLYLTFFDKASFFSFKIEEITQAVEQEKGSIALLDNSASFGLTPSQQTPLTSLESLVAEHEQTVKLGGVLGWLSEQLNNTKEQLVTLLEEIKTNQNPMAYFWLLFFSLLYGVIHAIGPGHGKSLVAAYFLGNNRSVAKAFWVSALIGVVHTFSAFLLTFTIFYILNAYMDEHFYEVEHITLQISAVIIILIALYLLYKRLPKRPKPLVKTAIWSQNMPKDDVPNSFTWSGTKNHEAHEHSCGCGACQSESSDLGVILSAGIVPCPGTVTIFIFTLSLGVYWVGFLSAVFMSLGMSLIIFIAAYLSLKIRKTTMGSDRVRKILDYGSLVFILGLGVLLLIAT
ncbi:MAG TPA: hypothetical protein ENK82_06515, partial [Campylobacterales bacterium]|nr:hypothetical protein [Campylobacterales bacterium]